MEATAPAPATAVAGADAAISPDVDAAPLRVDLFAPAAEAPGLPLVGLADPPAAFAVVPTSTRKTRLRGLNREKSGGLFAPAGWLTERAAQPPVSLGHVWCLPRVDAVLPRQRSHSNGACTRTPVNLEKLD